MQVPRIIGDSSLCYPIEGFLDACGQLTLSRKLWTIRIALRASRTECLKVGAELLQTESLLLCMKNMEHGCLQRDYRDKLSSLNIALFLPGSEVVRPPVGDASVARIR